VKSKPITRAESLKRAGLALGSVLLTLALVETVLRLTNLATDLPWVQGDPVLGFKFVPNQTGTWVVGTIGDNKAKYRINSDGWNAIADYREKRDQATTRIALIGDSFVEALNVPPEEAVSAVLERALSRSGKVEVYPFGISGASLGHYLAILRYVRQRFSPDLYIINIVHNDFHESLATADRSVFHGLRRTGSSYEEVLPQTYRPSSFRRIIGQSALARYLLTNLKLMSKLENIGRMNSPSRGNQPRQFEANIDVSNINVKEMKRLLRFLVEKYLREVGDDPQKIVFVMDTEREKIYEGTHPRSTSAFQYNKLTSDICRDLSLYCLDLTDHFWEDFQRNKRRFNSAIDGHWNEHGHEVAASAIEGFLMRNHLWRRTSTSFPGFR